MQFDRYANRAAELAARLVNRHDEPEPITASGIAALLAADGLHLRVRRADLPEIATLAAELRTVFAAGDVTTAIDRLNRLLAATPMSPRISTHDDRGPHLHVEPARASVADRLRANCLMGLAAVLCDGGQFRLGECAAADCRRVFVDTSRNARRRFCTDTCATRTHVAAHRARRAATRAAHAPR